jgi:hydrogenase maturation protease
MARVRVLGFGNPDVGDDAVGVLAVRAAGDDLRALGAEVLAGVSPSSAMYLLAGAEAIVVVDAVRTTDGRREPGQLVRLEAGEDELTASVRTSLSSHGLGVAELVALEAALGHRPTVVVLGLEAGTTIMGDRLSPPVEAALPDLVDAIRDEVARLVA